MRIIRFVGDDSREHLGEQHADGRARLLLDPLGILGQNEDATHRQLLRGKRAVVADDDENMRSFMSTVLTRAGCRCTVCADGAEAVAAIEAATPDLVVADIVMPHRTGYEIFSVARQRDKHLPVVLVTGFGYDPDHTLLRASREGLESILYKPFTASELVSEITRAIRHSLPDPMEALVRNEQRFAVERLLAPVRPPNILCIGRNYPGGSEAAADPAEELEVFLKPTTSAQGPGGAIRLPDFGDVDPQVSCEGELAIIIGCRAQRVSREEALQHILGFTIANDVTARRWQSTGGPGAWMRGKGFDTFCPLGPAVVTRDELGDPQDLGIRTMINGTVIREGSTRQMLHPVDSIVSELSRRLTLEPATVILTGAPPLTAAGRSRDAVAVGDEVAIEIEGIGTLRNRVEASP